MLVGGVSGRSASHISCLLMFIVRLGMLLMLVDVHVHVETSSYRMGGVGEKCVHYVFCSDVGCCQRRGAVRSVFPSSM